MMPAIHDPVQLREEGFAALVTALGWVNAVRFMQQYEPGQGDYTRERDQFLPDWDAKTLVGNAGKAERPAPRKRRSKTV